MTGKNKKKIKPEPKRKKAEASEPQEKPSAAPREAAIGVVGWNAPRYLESHGGFIEAVKKSVSMHGGLPLFFGISGGGDPLAAANGAAAPRPSQAQSFKTHYWLPSRDLVADQIEMLVHEEHLAGLVMVPWSVTSLVGMMMAAARCGVPTIFLPNYASWFGALAPDLGEKLHYNTCSMPILLEVFGLARIGTFESVFSNKERPGQDPAEALAQIESAEWGGKRIVEMAKQNFSPKRFFTPGSFHNAVSADMALGSSTETVLHLGALALEAGIPLQPVLFNDACRKVPQLAAMNAKGDYTMEDFRKAGGLTALLGAIHGFLEPAPTVTGRNLTDLAREHDASRAVPGFKLNHPFRKHGGLGILFGNLAPEGAIFRVAALKEAQMSGSGPARVFDSKTACSEAIRAKKVKKGDVIVLRYCGPRGSPGMPVMDEVQEAIRERGLEDSIALITDGRFSSSGRTPALVHVSPEAAVGSALSILQDGDLVRWSFLERSLTVRLTDTEIKVRLSRWKEQEKNMRNSYLYRYSKYSSSCLYGARLV